MLQVKDLTRISDGNEVLSDVTFQVESGEFVSILGPTGSGKTSLLRMILGLDLPDTGEVRFDGELLAKKGQNLVPPERRGFTLVFEKTTLLPFMNVEDNILVGAGQRDESTEKLLEEVLDLLGLDGLRARSVHHLSGGEQQRVALARSLLVRPKLILLDEPFRNIDRPWRDRLIPMLKRYLAERGTTAVLVTHDRDEAFSFSERIFLLSRGRLVRSDTPFELYQHPMGDWDARLLGECNLLTPRAALETFGFEPSSDDVKWVAVRPEHLQVSAEPPHNATLEEVRFFGFYKTLKFQIQNQVSVLVKVLADEEFEKGRYRLQLKSREHGREITSKEAPAESE